MRYPKVNWKQEIRANVVSSTPLFSRLGYDGQTMCSPTSGQFHESTDVFTTSKTTSFFPGLAGFKIVGLY